MQPYSSSDTASTCKNSRFIRSLTCQYQSMMYLCVCWYPFQLQWIILEQYSSNDNFIYVTIDIFYWGSECSIYDKKKCCFLCSFFFFFGFWFLQLFLSFSGSLHHNRSQLNVDRHTSQKEYWLINFNGISNCLGYFVLRDWVIAYIVRFFFTCFQQFLNFFAHCIYQIIIIIIIKSRWQYWFPWLPLSFIPIIYHPRQVIQTTSGVRAGLT